MAMLAFGIVLQCNNAQNVMASTYSLSVSYSGAQSIDAAPVGTGTSIAEDEITVTTTCRSGYNFTLGASVSDNNLYLNGDSTVNTAGEYFAPSDGVTALSSAINTWGYYYNTTTAPSATSVFSAVPAYGSTAATIISPTASATDISDTFSIYYGVAVDTDTPIGTYKMVPDSSDVDGSIVYYATMAEACITYTVSYNPTSTAGGTTVTGTGTMSDQTIYEGVATNLTTNGFTEPSGYYFAGWNTAQDGTGTSYADGASVTDLGAVGSTTTLYAQWTDCPSGYICYDSNAGSDTISGTMANQSVGTSATSAMLQAYNYKRSGYSFLGWSTVESPTIGTDTIYGPMETISFSALSSGGLKLYAVWLAKDATYTMQTFTSSVCSSNLTAITYDSTTATFTVRGNSFIALEDNRDGNIYTVARLTDGNCWMLENLRIDENATASAISSGSQGIGGSFTKLADSEDQYFANNTTANSLYSTGSGYTMPRYNKNNTNIGGTNASGTALVASYDSNNNYSQWYGYGNYYTWAAARASTTAITGNTTTSLCPTNWRMPIGNNSTATYSFGALSVSMGGTSATMNKSTTPTGAVMSARLRQFPNNFVYSGYWDSARALSRGSNGRYWSSTANGSSSAYIYFNSTTGVDPGTSNNTDYSGNSVRCVAGS